jgi:D-amino-acid dehydrogenase
MRVVVLGAGLTGVTSAWYLAEAGHEVTVLERRSAPALETSFANGGQISVSHPEPWANPGAPLQILRWLGREDAPLKFRPRRDPNQWLWGIRFLLECLPGRSEKNAGAIAALSLYSRARLQELRRATGIDYDCLTRGILHLFFDRASLSRAEPRARLLRGYGMQVEVLDRRGCLEVEPALAGCRDTLLGALYAPQDESGDACKFTQALAQHGAARGVGFRFATTIAGLETQDGSITGVALRDADGAATVRADAYVVCMGSYGPPLLAPLGERLPIYPVKGYSVTLALAEPAAAPRVSITDESRRIVCSRLGSRLRAAGTAELAGYDTSINAARCRAILERARELFPDAADQGEPQFWAGLRPATPSNLPIIGRSRYGNLYYNTGHGTLGWTLACGSARALADIVAGRRPEPAFPFCGVA